MNAAKLVRRQCLARTPLADFFRILLRLFRIPDCREIMLSENGRLVQVVFEFEEIVRGVFEKKGMMLDRRARKTHAGVLKKLQSLGLRTIGELLPIVFRQKNQSEVSRINTSLLDLLRLGQMPH